MPDGKPILLLVAVADRVQLPEDAVADLIGLGCNVWAAAGAIEITGQPPLAFHRVLAQNGIYLIEDLDDAAARTVPPRGHLVALPLRLEQVSGSIGDAVIAAGVAYAEVKAFGTVGVEGALVNAGTGARIGAQSAFGFTATLARGGSIKDRLIADEAAAVIEHRRPDRR